MVGFQGFRVSLTTALSHHSCATLLFTMGVEAATVQRILRHSSITVTTGTYVEVIERVQRDALDTMGTFFDAD
ncbi:hypothetical protein ACFFQW_07995 [Umezawaea endophytica]|uniref:Phage integrase family protein n=1 Tax=Umezawaea endophytica TaxID=1654476 RepID=A0A9X2VGB5_9PSEU|nr:hypothetical protein [Umezawaea endophytica]MCS7475924.1 hypothetical protein [Umezawaea endophytica]